MVGQFYGLYTFFLIGFGSNDLSEFVMVLFMYTDV